MASELIELHDQMVNCAGYEILGRMKYRRFKVEIFKANVAEIRSFLEGLTTTDLTRDVIDGEHIEINRLFQNFVAGAAILIDQTRVFMNDYYAGTQLQTDYQSYIDQHAAKDELCKFVKDLRNYATHNSLPVHFYKNSVERGVLRRSFAIGLQQLRESRRWSPESKGFIASQTGDIEPLNIIEPYEAKTLALHVWLDAAIEIFHAAELAELAALRARYEAACDQLSVRQ